MLLLSSPSCELFTAKAFICIIALIYVHHFVKFKMSLAYWKKSSIYFGSEQNVRLLTFFLTCATSLHYRYMNTELVWLTNNLGVLLRLPVLTHFVLLCIHGIALLKCKCSFYLIFKKHHVTKFITQILFSDHFFLSGIIINLFILLMPPH